MSQVKTVTSNELNTWLKQDEVTLIDVREPFEFAAERIDGAINVPLSEINVKIEKILPNPNKKVVMQCKSGYRSFLACQMMQAEGMLFDVYNLEGGIQAWKSLKLLTSKQPTHQNG